MFLGGRGREKESGRTFIVKETDRKVCPGLTLIVKEADRKVCPGLELKDIF